MSTVAQVLGEVGLPAPISELAAQTWDTIVVGGGHNGLTTAAYLARAGQRVLVLEKSARLGGACTLERPFPDQRYVVSPCAYVVGLLDQVVIDELDLKRHGLEVFVAEPNLWAPFEDGTSFTEWSDPARTQASLESLGVSPADIAGYWAYEAVFDEMRKRLRCGTRDTWRGESPDRAELERLLNDAWMSDILFEASIADVMSYYFSDTRLHDALFGQAVIGAYAGPHDAGTASVKLMHYQGDLEGQGSVWGYVKGGMGMVSFTIAEAALEAGAVLASDVEVCEIVPGEGVRLAGGEFLSARTLVCNADPKRLLNMVDVSSADAVPAAYRTKLTDWKMRSPVVKLNASLHRLPTFTAAPNESWPYRSMITVTEGMEAAQRAFADCERGIPNVGFGEVYFQTGFDPSPAPEGKHLLSVFGQYAPYELAEGTWDSQRKGVERQFINLLARFAPDIEDCIEFVEVLGGPDIERKIGLTGGHIFQGETMPDQMWEHRLTSRTPIPGVYLCGASTHPAGSVIALNGRNAADAVLADSAPTR